MLSDLRVREGLLCVYWHTYDTGVFLMGIFSVSIVTTLLLGGSFGEHLCLLADGGAAEQREGK